MAIRVDANPEAHSPEHSPALVGVTVVINRADSTETETRDGTIIANLSGDSLITHNRKSRAVAIGINVIEAKIAIAPTMRMFFCIRLPFLAMPWS